MDNLKLSRVRQEFGCEHIGDPGAAVTAALGRTGLRPASVSPSRSEVAALPISRLLSRR